MSKSTHLPIDMAHKVILWLQTHEAELKHETSVEAVKRLKADTGLDLTKAQILRLVRGMKIDLFTHGTRRMKNFNVFESYDVVSILAKSIIELANEIGHPLVHSDRLYEIIARKLKGDASCE